MPGPKMGPRPADFDEATIKSSPTFLKWAALEDGKPLRYACRDFVKGRDDDEERLMRRIMIARRNNIKDHQTLKQARKVQQKQQQTKQKGASKRKSQKRGRANDAKKSDLVEATEDVAIPLAEAENDKEEGEEYAQEHATGEPPRKRRSGLLFTDVQIAREMDVAAVEATRSYQTWCDLSDGEEFVYNQKYVKGKEGADWLLRKNIWRRMRYRRENKQMVQRMKVEAPDVMGVTERSGSKMLLRAKKTTSSASSGETCGNQAICGAYPAHDPTNYAASFVELPEPMVVTGHQILAGDHFANGDLVVDDNALGLSDQISHGHNMALSKDNTTIQAASAAAAMASDDANDYSVETAAAVEAAVAVAESYAKSPYDVVHNPIVDTATTANSAALDAAARLAAAAASAVEAIKGIERDNQDDGHGQDGTERDHSAVDGLLCHDEATIIQALADDTMLVEHDDAPAEKMLKSEEV